MPLYKLFSRLQFLLLDIESIYHAYEFLVLWAATGSYTGIFVEIGHIQ